MSETITRRTFAIGAVAAGLTATGLASCAPGSSSGSHESSSGHGSGSHSDQGSPKNQGKQQDTVETIDLQILATSDTHGKMTTWDYLNDADDPAGSMAQVATLVAQKRTDSTLVLDAGDTIQDNFANIFLGKDYVHPMVQAMNAIGYDVWTTGNHEYNYGIDKLKKVIADQKATPLVGNVTDPAGNQLAGNYTVLERGGVRIGIIGMVTPNITIWDGLNLAGYTVANPIDETRKAIEELKDSADILVALVHMDELEEYDVYGSGADDLAEACPELDVIISAHGHKSISKTVGDGIVLVENKKFAKTVSEIHLTVEKSKKGCTITDKTCSSITVADYEPSQEIVDLLEPYDAQAKTYGREAIGAIVDVPLVPVDNVVKGIPPAILGYIPAAGLVGQVELYYSGAAVAAAKSEGRLNFQTGEFHRCDASALYPYDNTLCMYEMTGRQLRSYMEYTFSLYKTYEEGDLTVAFDGAKPSYIAQTFAGVNYEVDLTQPVGSRTSNLRWPDGTSVDDDESFEMALAAYDYNTFFGEGLGDGTTPKLLGADMRSDLGDIRCLIADYIENVCGGVVVPDPTANWKIVGCDWDEELHKKAIEEINAGIIVIEPESDHGLAPRAVKAEDL